MLALTVVGLFAAFWLCVLLSGAQIAGALFGWNLGTDGTTITYVTPGGAAARAGIELGDKVQWESLQLMGRANLALIQAVLPGSRLHVTVERDEQQLTFVVDARTWDAIEQNSVRVFTFAGIVLTAFGIVLVYLRPGRMTWGFLFSFLPAADGGYLVLLAQRERLPFMLANGVTSLMIGASVAGILTFVSRFPMGEPRGPLVLVDRIALPLGIVTALLGIYIDANLVWSSAPPQAWLLFANQYLAQLLFAVVATGALVASFALASGAERQRIVPVLLAFGAYVISTAAGNVFSAAYTNQLWSAIFNLLESASMVALAVSVAHGILKHRVIDVSFAISRTVVYTALTSLIVGVFVLIDFVSSKVLEHLQIAIILEAATALAFGFWLNSLHSRIDRFVDRVLFRRRHLAEARLDRAAKTVLHSEGLTFIDEVLVLEPCEALDLASAAVFRREHNEDFIRVYDLGWDNDDLERLPRQDHLVISLLAELEPVNLADVRWPRTNVPEGIHQPILAVPVVIRHELLGLVLYGGHTGGEAIDPDERATLVNLSRAAAAAYDHAHSKSLLAEATRLRAENALLAHDQQLLREMVQTLGGASPR